MSDAISEFETGRRGGPDTYGDAGCRLVGLGAFAMVLRHHRYDWKCNDSVHLFARDPELGAQVFIEIFPGGAEERDWREELRSYEEQRSDFRLPRGLRFDASFLAPAAIGFARHIALRTRDGRTRKRIVHAFEGRKRNILLVYSRDDNHFHRSRFFETVRVGLTLADKAIARPFRR